MLSTNVADSLSKKLAIRDYKRLSKDRDLDLISQLGVPSTQKHKSMIDHSRDLTHSGGLAGESASEANNEFDYLLQTMNHDTDEVSEEEDVLGTSAARRAQSAASTPYRQTPGVAAAVARRSALKTPRSASAGRARPSTPHSGVNISPSKKYGASHSAAAVGGPGVEALRQTVEALVKQNERLEERLAIHQRELATLRENQRGGVGGGVGVGATPGRMSTPGSPTRMLNGSMSSAMGKLLFLLLIFVAALFVPR